MKHQKTSKQIFFWFHQCYSVCSKLYFQHYKHCETDGLSWAERAQSSGGLIFPHCKVTMQRLPHNRSDLLHFASFRLFQQKLQLWQTGKQTGHGLKASQHPFCRLFCAELKQPGEGITKSNTSKQKLSPLPESQQPHLFDFLRIPGGFVILIEIMKHGLTRNVRFFIFLFFLLYCLTGNTGPWMHHAGVNR